MENITSHDRPIVTSIEIMYILLSIILSYEMKVRIDLGISNNTLTSCSRSTTVWSLHPNSTYRYTLYYPINTIQF